ncbi:MAG: tRNA (N(6)-L-threonylcarbamoyladenosine(37)-C(2))-methylthiotransferase [archaeon]
MKKIFIKTYGCSFNQSDSEIMAGLLEHSGRYMIVINEKKADLVIINSCTVKTKAESKFWKDIRDIKKPKILAGCVPQADPFNTKLSDFSVIGTNSLTSIVDVADETLAGNAVKLLKKSASGRLNIPKIRRNAIVEIVPINEGCLGSCDFCKTIFARGHLKSYQIDDIVKHIRNALNDGAKEIWLTSQDTACYGYDIKTNIVELLKRILEMKRDFKVRLGMGNPDYMTDYLPELIEIFNDKRMFKFLHIPVQSGSDNVLKAMKRNYTVAKFKRIVSAFRKKHPEITISTDLIVGYPCETDADFEKSMSLIKSIEPDVLNLSRFWARPGTLAAKKKQLRTEIVKERGIKATKIWIDTAKNNNAGWEGWTGEILIDEIGKNKSFVGRNYAYKPVIVKGDFRIGDTVRVKINNATKDDLRGEIINTN